MNSYIKEVLDGLRARYPWESEFLQASEEVLESITPLIEAEPKYRQQKILERIIEPRARRDVPRALGSMTRANIISTAATAYSSIQP